MIKVDNVLVSDNIKERQFVCDLERCKGACCVEGDMGAPLEETELDDLDEVYRHVKPYMDKKGIEVVEEQGSYERDPFDKEYVTTTVNNRECVFAVHEDNGILSCAIEKAWYDGKIRFRKPISCHLYPIRIRRYDEYTAVNYDMWDICKAACIKGKKAGVALYRFLKEPLIRKFGKPWYEKLVALIEKGEEAV